MMNVRCLLYQNHFIYYGFIFFKRENKSSIGIRSTLWQRHCGVNRSFLETSSDSSLLTGLPRILPTQIPPNALWITVAYSACLISTISLTLASTIPSTGSYTSRSLPPRIPYSDFRTFPRPFQSNSKFRTQSNSRLAPFKV